jgi:uncharacterized protein YdaU (DUF1376 family)
MNYVERHFGDWARDTAHLSMLEEGAYNRLVDLYYVRETPLPIDLTACCRLARAMTASERAAVKSVLAEFFDQTDDGWTHKRCDREIDRFRTKSGKASASAKARWGAPPNADAKPDAPAHANASAKAVRHARAATSSQAPLPTPQAPETAQPEVAPSGGSRSSPRPTRKAPPDFAPSPEMRTWAKANAPGVNVDAEAEKLRDHTFATARSDWDGTFRNWLRKAAEHAPRNGGKPQQPTSERDAEAMRLLGIDPRSQHHHA